MHTGNTLLKIWSVFLMLFMVGNLSGCGYIQPKKKNPMETTVVAEESPAARGEKEKNGAVIEKRQPDLSMAKTLKNVSQTEYILGPEDKLQITVFRREEMDLQVAVTQTGKISYYLVGDLFVAGMTQFELRDKLEELLSDYIIDPKVVVKVIEHRSQKIYVLGQFNKPGVFRIQGDFSLLEAVSRAGGLAENSYLGGAYVVRDGNILLVNFVELIEKGNTSENIPLLAGDIIYVPSNKDHIVYVLGEVKKQSGIQIRDGMTLLGAITEAGGFTDDANMNRIVVMRGNLSQPLMMEIDAAGMDMKTRIDLQPKDIVYVPPTTFAGIEKAAVRIANILKPFLFLSQAVVWGDAAEGILFKNDESRYLLPE